MEELIVYNLEDLSIGKGCYGIAASAVPFDKNKYAYLRITDIKDDGTLARQSLMSVDDERASNYILKKDDIVFARTGNSTGRSYFYDGSDGTLVYAGFLIKFSLNKDLVNPRILKYYTHSKPYYDWVHTFDTGGTRGNINAQTYGKMPITLPARNTQDQIVEILKSLDDKINLNSQINDNLEKQAQALYKSWFIDFEPFKNGKFIDSELGKIPEGWKVVSLGEITREVKDKVEDKMDIKVLSPISSGSLVLSEDYFTKQVYSQNLSKYTIVRPNDFAYNPARINIGSIGQNTFDFNGCVSPVYVVFRCESGYNYYFDLLKTTGIFREEVKVRSIGGVRQTLNYSDFSLIKNIYPPKYVIEDFNVIYKTFLDLMVLYKSQSTQLATLRDALLPKLMSGKLKIDEINC